MWRQSTPTSVLDGWRPALLGLAALACRQDMHNQPRCKPLSVSTFFADGRSARPLVAGTVARGTTKYSPSFYTGRNATLSPAKPPATAEASHPAQLPLATAQPMASPPAHLPSAAAQPMTSQQPHQTLPADREQLAAWRAIAAAQTLDATAQPDDSVYTNAFPFPLSMQVLTRGQERFDIYCAVCHDRTGSGNGMIVRKGFSRPPSLHSERLARARIGQLFEVITNGFGAMPAYASQLTPTDRWAIVSYLRALQLSQHASLSDVPPDERQDLVRSAGSGGTP